jgi:hypothetical protein
VRDYWQVRNHARALAAKARGVTSTAMALGTADAYREAIAAHQAYIEAVDGNWDAVGDILSCAQALLIVEAMERRVEYLIEQAAAEPEHPEDVNNEAQLCGCGDPTCWGACGMGVAE